MKNLVLYFFCISLFSSDFTTHTLKSINFKISLNSSWKIQKNITPKNFIVHASNKDEEISFVMYSNKKTNGNSLKIFKQLNQNLHLKIVNFSKLVEESQNDFSLKNGYFASVENKNNQKGYSLLANDGINEIFVYIYTDKNKFSENYKTLRETLKGFSFNFNYDSYCCNLCQTYIQNNKTQSSCLKVKDSNCKIYFKNNFEKCM